MTDGVAEMADSIRGVVDDAERFDKREAIRFAMFACATWFARLAQDIGNPPDELKEGAPETKAEIVATIKAYATLVSLGAAKCDD